MATLYKDSTVRQLITQSVDERPLAFFYVASFSCTISKFRISPASESVEVIGFYPPTDSDVVKVGRPDPGVFFPAVVTATLGTVQMHLSPWV